MIYLASPYSNDPKSNFEQVESATARLLLNGYIIYSPIVHCHAIAEKYKLPTDAEFWSTYNRGMLAKASELWILTLPGWDDSTGVRSELNFAHQCGIATKLLSELTPDNSPILQVYPKWLTK